MKKMMTFRSKNVKPEFIGKSNKVRLRVVDQTCLDTLLLNDSISLDDYKVLDLLAMDFNLSGMVGIKASSYSPRITANYDNNNDNKHILKRKVNECIGCLKSAGGSGCYNVLMKILTDRELTRPDMEFFQSNIRGIIKPINEFYENWRKS
tara:strand:+ start:3767 stop:4216 length:450 start_codon:yes stop_codon:yes gene_type:complete